MIELRRKNFASVTKVLAGGYSHGRRFSSKLFVNLSHGKDLAKYMAQQCFRNTVLEDFHAGITPYSEAGDDSDVVVKTPAGTVPWSKLSRLNDQEMKTLILLVACVASALAWWWSSGAHIQWIDLWLTYSSERQNARPNLEVQRSTFL